MKTELWLVSIGKKANFTVRHFDERGPMFFNELQIHVGMVLMSENVSYSPKTETIYFFYYTLFLTNIIKPL